MSSERAQTPTPDVQQRNAPGFTQVAPQTIINNRMRYGPGSIPPYPLIGEAFVEYATAQQRAVGTTIYLIEQHNMEIDAFGFARFREYSGPFENRAETFARNDVESAQAAAAAAGSASESGPTLPEHGQFSQDDIEDTQTPILYQPGSSEIVSEDNPKFRDVARQLSELQISSVIAPIPAQKPTNPFIPSYMALEKKGLVEQPSRNPNSNYLGHSTKQERHKVPDALNCGLWLWGLHPETTVEDLLGTNGAVQTGAVYALNLIPPQNGYLTAAASLYFMRQSGAELFLSQANSPSGIRVRGERIKAKYNSYGQEQYAYLDRSRVLVIRGPAGLMTREFWEAFFRECVEYQLSHVRQRREGGQMLMEFGFARVDGQAFSLKIAIEKQEKFRGILEVECAPDPSDPDVPGL